MMRRLLWNNYWHYLMLLPNHTAKNRKLLFQLKAARPMLLKGPYLLKGAKRNLKILTAGREIQLQPQPLASLI